MPRLRPDVHDLIGRRLKLHYEELQAQPLPEHLSDLLDALDRCAEDPAAPRRR